MAPDAARVVGEVEAAPRESGIDGPRRHLAVSEREGDALAREGSTPVASPARSTLPTESGPRGVEGADGVSLELEVLEPVPPGALST